MIRAILAAAVLTLSVGAFAQEGTSGTTAPTAAAPDTATTTSTTTTTMKKKTRAECKKELGKNAKDKAAMKECLAGK